MGTVEGGCTQGYTLVLLSETLFYHIIRVVNNAMLRPKYIKQSEFAKPSQWRVFLLC